MGNHLFFILIISKEGQKVGAFWFRIPLNLTSFSLLNKYVTPMTKKIKKKGIMSHRITLDQFISDCSNTHNYTYSYELIDSLPSIKSKVRIICPVHGVFEQVAEVHRKGGGCKKCADERKGALQRLSTSEFIEKARKIHGNKYDYTRVVYKTQRDKVEIICPIHGSFKQLPTNHLGKGNECGCPQCGLVERSLKRVKDTSTFVKEALSIHGDFYSYNKTQYKSHSEKITITCPIHGDFTLKPVSHLQGCGCPLCKKSISFGERTISSWLLSHNIKFCREKSFPGCRNKKPLRFDFYLPNINTLIEFDGRQHFNPTTFFGGKDSFMKTLKNDDIKNQFAKSAGMRLIRISYKENIADVLEGLI